MDSVIRRNDIGAWSRAPLAIHGSRRDGPLLLAISDQDTQGPASELAKASAHQEQSNIHTSPRLSANYTRIGRDLVLTLPMVSIDGLGAGQVVQETRLGFRIVGVPAATRYQLAFTVDASRGRRV